MNRDPQETYDQPLEVVTLGQDVVITGPGPAGIALTAAAAAVSAKLLAEAAREAVQQSSSDAAITLADDAGSVVRRL
jgi:NADPH-dependent 2,4-dienoyl-CoA reductase/sulfur reductase-like enzyme